MTLLVRDEEDIVAANLDHHLDLGIDFVVATDNGSVDSTPEILRGYERQGVLRLLQEPSHDYSQHRWVTQMARLAATEHGADWVVNNDADEFWLPAQDDFQTTLAPLPPEVDVVAARRHNMVGRRQGGDPSTLVFRYLQSCNVLGEPLGGKVAHRARPDITVLQGNHEVTAPGLGDCVDDGRLEILHYPARTREQFERSVRNGGSAYRANSELPPEVGAAVRWLYERLEAGKLEQVWCDLTCTDEEIAAGVAEGRFTEDRRVADHLASLAGGALR